MMDSLSISINEAKMLISQGRLAEAEKILERAMHGAPEKAELLELLGNVCFKQLKLTQAKKYFEKCLSLTSEPLIPLLQLTQVTMQSHDYDAAETYLKTLAKLVPDNFMLAFYYAKLAAIQCDWARAQYYRDKLDIHNRYAMTQNNKLPVEFPLSLNTRTMDSEYIYQLSKYYCHLQFDQLKSFAYSTYPSFKTKSKIRLGYLSDDFCDHPVGHLIYQLFQYHNKDDFEVHLYAYNIKQNDMFYTEAAQGCQRVIDITTLSHEQTAKQIHEDNIDILIDLKGHTANNRLAIFAFKPAPIQIAYLGYPGTTGADFIDYIIADSVIVSEQQQKYYSEQVLYLPQCYQVNPGYRTVSDTSVNRKELGLPENAVILGCFNWSYKIEQNIFELWCDILNATSNSILWLLETNAQTKTNLLAAAAKKGLSADRIYFAPLENKPEHLSRMKLVDLILDTYTCNGHTTTSDALYVGIPVLSCKGKHFASSVAASILTTANLTELITYDLNEYKTKAIELVMNPHLLNELKNKVKNIKSTSSLFNTKDFCKLLENIYQDLINEK